MSDPEILELVSAPPSSRHYREARFPGSPSTLLSAARVSLSSRSEARDLLFTLRDLDCRFTAA